MGDDMEMNYSMALLISNKLKSNYILDHKSATEEVIKDLREFSKVYGETIEKLTESAKEKTI